MATKDFANLVSGTNIAEGTYKKLNLPDVVTDKQGESFSTVFRPGQTKSNFLIGEFKPDGANLMQSMCIMSFYYTKNLVQTVFLQKYTQ